METIEGILQGCVEGDERSVARLIHDFRQWALHTAESIVKDRDLAEDVTQEAFLTVLAKLPSLRDREAFPGWFRQIIRTHAYRALSRTREAVTVGDDDRADTKPTPDELAQREELRAKVRDAIRALPRAGRQATEMFYLNGMSCAEIAGQLTVPEATVRRRLHDGRRQLRGMLLGYIDPDRRDRNEGSDGSLSL